MDKTLYIEKLRHPKWQEKKGGILRRDGYKCTVCDDKNTMLDVHHKIYGKEPWDIEDKYLVTLCHRCHIVVEICKKAKIKPLHLNKISYAEERYVYLVNSKVSMFKTNGDFVYVVHNFTKSGDFTLIMFSFSTEFLGFMLNTF